jgi:tight adherence protein B
MGAGAAALVLILTRNPLFAAAAALVAILGPPFVYLKFMGARRAKALSLQLPDALEVIVRSLEAGHPVPTAISLVGREMLDPIGSEFGMAGDEIAFGSTLEMAVAHMASRCRHPDIDLFAATIRLQDRSGGNLTGLLRMNAHTVRERRKLRMKIAAATSEGRISAVILTSAPFCVLGILQLIQPHFYGDVIHEKAIQYGLAGLGTWMFIGNIVMRKMINIRI